MGSDQNTLKVMAGLAYTLLVRSDRRTGGSSKNSLQRKNQADPQKDPKRSAGEQQVERPPPISCSLGPGPTQLHRAMGDFPDLMICVMFYIQPNRGLPLHPLLTRPNVLISFFSTALLFFSCILLIRLKKEREKQRLVDCKLRQSREQSCFIH